MFSKLRGRIKYNHQWREDFPWVEPVENNYHAAKCKLCKSVINVDSMGRTALKSHAQSKKHISRCQQTEKTLPIAVFLRPPQPDSHVSPSCPSSSSSIGPVSLENTPISAAATNSSESCSSTSNIATLGHTPSPCATFTSSCSDSTTEPPCKKRKLLDTFVTKENVTKAEILWCLLSVTTHMSLRAAASAASLMKVMFPNDDIANGMQLQKSKISYTIVHGLGPYFSNSFKKRLDKCTYFVVAFDESLNKIAQRQQMDINIRFWDDDKNMVVTQYYDSVFLDHTTAEDLLKALKTSLKELDLKKMVQLSMDGPNVNFKLFRILKEDLAAEPDDPKLLDIGSCGLHTVHCAFKNGIKGTRWCIVPFLRAIYNLFKDVPARRGDFTAITGSREFPLKFCSVRWLENGSVAERALKMLPHLEKYCSAVKGTKAEPKCNSFSTISKALSNPLLRAQLAFFQALSEKVTPFLREFQSDHPLVPFLYTALSNLTRSVMNQIVKKDVIDKTPLKDIDLNDNKILLESKHVDLGFGTRNALRKCTNITTKDTAQFREECKTCLVIFSKKMFDRSPLKYKLSKALTCLDPQKVGLCQSVELDLRSSLDVLVTNNRISATSADRVLSQFQRVVEEPGVREKMKNFKRSEERLDCFWMEVIHSCIGFEVKELREFIKIACVLSHGNAAVERGFSLNKECLVPNQHERSLVAQRHVIEAVNMLGGVDKVTVTKEMIHAARNSRARYDEAIALEKKQNEERRKAAEEKKIVEARAKQLKIEKQKVMEESERKVIEIDEELKALKNKM